jgi:thioredoxin-like negative regulator of GroEL
VSARAPDLPLAPAEFEAVRRLLGGGTAIDELLAAQDTLDPAQAHQKYLRACTLYEQGHYLDAARLYHAVLLRAIGQPHCMRGLAACLQKLDRPAAAAPLYALSWAQLPDDPAPLLYCAECLWHEKKFDEARTVLDAFFEEVEEGAALPAALLQRAKAARCKFDEAQPTQGETT